jgi:dolichyl-phosphate-mannose--protein O-mannosyl transferase
MLFALIIQLLFASPIWTFAGGLLLATESLNVVQSRTGTLDIFIAFWIVLGLLFLLLDRRWIERRTPRPPPRSEPEDGPFGQTRDGGPPRLPSPVWRPYRFAAGAAMGGAMAVKWSGLTGVATAIVIAFGWEAMRRKRFGMRHPIRDAVVSEGFGLVISLMVVPAIVYTATYTGWFNHFDWDLAKWIDIHGKSARFHADLDALNESGEPWHAYFSPAWQWILLRRPVYYYADYSTEGIRQVIYANGNPAIFWGAIAAIPYVAYAWWRRHDWRAGFVVVAIAGLYLPWFLVSRPQFLFYATPITPFLVLACVYAIRNLSELRVAGSRSRPYLPVAVGYVALSVMLFAWFWPILTGGPLTDAAFKLRYWFTTWV